MGGRTHLDWPFFEPRHRSLGSDLDAWARDHLSGAHEKDTDEACRKLVRQFGDGRWGLVAEAQGSPLLDECAFAVVDVETTGMRAAGSDRITEIAVVVVHGGRREVVVDSLINPGRTIPPAVRAITNITD